MLLILKDAKGTRNIYYINVTKDLGHQQMCRPKKEKSCAIDAKNKDKKTEKQTISIFYKHGTMLAYLSLLKNGNGRIIRRTVVCTNNCINPEQKSNNMGEENSAIRSPKWNQSTRIRQLKMPKPKE